MSSTWYQLTPDYSYFYFFVSEVPWKYSFMLFSNWFSLYFKGSIAFEGQVPCKIMNNWNTSLIKLIIMCYVSDVWQSCQ